MTGEEIAAALWWMSELEPRQREEVLEAWRDEKRSRGEAGKGGSKEGVAAMGESAGSSGGGRA